MRMIDADELLMLIDNHDNMVLEDVNSSCLKDVYKMAHVHIKDLIGMMPTIEERKTGKWEEREVLSEKVIDEWQSARCSVCGRYHTTPYMYYFDSFSFCPNCGAQMEE